VQLSCILTSITAFATSLSPNIWTYAFFRFTNGFARSGIGICCLVLTTESVGRKWRGQVGQYGFFFFTIGFLTLPLVALAPHKRENQRGPSGFGQVCKAQWEAKTPQQPLFNQP